MESKQRFMWGHEIRLALVQPRAMSQIAPFTGGRALANVIAAEGKKVLINCCANMVGSSSRLRSRPEAVVSGRFGWEEVRSGFTVVKRQVSSIIELDL